MATTKLTAPRNLGYLDGFNAARPGDQRSDWDAEQRRAYWDGYQEGTDYRAETERTARLAVHARIRANEGITEHPPADAYKRGAGYRGP